MSVLHRDRKVEASYTVQKTRQQPSVAQILLIPVLFLLGCQQGIWGERPGRYLLSCLCAVLAVAGSARSGVRGVWGVWDSR